MRQGDTKMLTIEYDLTIPELHALVPPIVERWRWLIPGWLHSLLITTEMNSTVSYIAKTKSSYPYRWAHIYVDTNMLAENDRSREKAIVHELCHLVLWPINENDKLWCVDDNKETSMIFTDGLEAAIQDLSEALISKHYDG